MLNKDQHQDVGAGSSAIQAGGDVKIVNVGLSYSDVRDVALDIFRDNFQKLSEPAMKLAQVRAEEITENFIKKLQQENPSGFEKAQDPDFQYSLFTVQKEFAKTGDKELGELLIDLLVDRSKQEQRDLIQIVLNESIKTAPKLTEPQIAALSIIFFFRHTQNQAITDYDSLGTYLDNFVLPLSSKLTKSRASYQHLAFAGCGNNELPEASLGILLQNVYPGLFSNGFHPSALKERQIITTPDSEIFTHCPNKPSYLRINANNKVILKKKLIECKIDITDHQKLEYLFNSCNMAPTEIETACISIRPEMSLIFETWIHSLMCSLRLTSVGIAIGHANIQRYAGPFGNLSTWIN